MATSYTISGAGLEEDVRGQDQAGTGTTGGAVREGALWAVVLTVYAVLIEGYHPFAEDGGLYLAGVRYALDPTLYSHSREFVTAPMRYSLFAPAMAGVVRGTGLPLEVVVLLVHVLCLWATLFAGFLLMREMTGSGAGHRGERLGGMLLLAAWLGLPVAGTSLTIADPYLTARSISTPCVLLALAGVLRWRRALRCGAEARAAAALSVGALVVGGCVHPLMAAHGAICMGCYVALDWRSRVGRGWRWLGGVLVAVAGCGVLARLAGPESAASRVVSLSRTYWFPGQWQWFELMGLGAPLVLMAVFALRARESAVRGLARACVAAGGGAVVLALLFAHPGSRSLLIGRLQPLRVFQVIYMVMTLLLGGLLGRMLGNRRGWWVMAAAVLGAVMVVPARAAFPASAWLELPSQGDRWVRKNPWEGAFVWAREHTPKDALFAVDADYIALPGEDAQGFRALAARSVLPDLAKDGGEAANTPALAKDWGAGVEAQRGLSASVPEERRRRLLPMGVTWVVLTSAARVEGKCPYDNGVVKVCPLR